MGLFVKRKKEESFYDETSRFFEEYEILKEKNKSEAELWEFCNSWLMKAGSDYELLSKIYHKMALLVFDEQEKVMMEVDSDSEMEKVRCSESYKRGTRKSVELHMLSFFYDYQYEKGFAQRVVELYTIDKSRELEESTSKRIKKLFIFTYALKELGKLDLLDNLVRVILESSNADEMRSKTQKLINQ